MMTPPKGLALRVSHPAFLQRVTSLAVIFFPDDTHAIRVRRTASIASQYLESDSNTATMADTAAAAPPAQDTPNLQLDEVTGEMVSKSELKKRQKKREVEKRKVPVARSFW
jgi:hypothetical protein